MDIADEVEALNSIYGEGSLVAAEDGSYVLSLPQQPVSLRIQFPDNYPEAPPSVLGTQSSGQSTKKGEAARILDLFRQTLGTVFTPGQVCLFDVIEEVSSSLGETIEEQDEPDEQEREDEKFDMGTSHPEHKLSVEPLGVQPPWVVSDVITEMKSVFVARSARVLSPDQAKEYLQHLLDSDKKVAKATHNITAWRIKGENGASFQDCDDDGETAAGGRVLHLMQLMDVWDVMVVITRWYGGQKLGPARFGIINSVARDALVKGGFVQEQETSKKKKR